MADIKETLFSLTRNLTKTSGDLVKTTKLSVNLAQEQEALKTLYVEIGKKVHEIYLYGGSLGKFFDEKYREIEAAERKIDGLKEEIGKIKGVKECPKCGKQVDKNAEFCPKCGLKMDGTAIEPSPRPVRPSVTEAPAAGVPVAVAENFAAELEPVAPLPEAAVPATPPPAVEAAPTQKVFCRVCGAENTPGTKFCLSCGRII